MTHPTGQVCYKGKTGKGEDIHMKDHNFFFWPTQFKCFQLLFLPNDCKTQVSLVQLDLTLRLAYSWSEGLSKMTSTGAFQPKPSNDSPSFSMMVSFLSSPSLALLLLPVLEEEEWRTGQQKHLTSHTANKVFPNKGAAIPLKGAIMLLGLLIGECHSPSHPARREQHRSIPSASRTLSKRNKPSS